MKPIDFQLLATRLVQGSFPAELRTAINRAYYAVYNVSVEILEEMGFSRNTGTVTHKLVQNRLSNSGVPELVRVATQLSDLYSRRLQADYHLHKRQVESQATAKALVYQADRMIDTIKKCCSGSRREEVMKAIRSWEQTTQYRTN